MALIKMNRSLVMELELAYIYWRPTDDAFNDGQGGCGWNFLVETTQLTTALCSFKAALHNAAKQCHRLGTDGSFEHLWSGKLYASARAFHQAEHCD